MKKGKRIWNKILSLILCLVMMTGMFAGMGMEAKAAFKGDTVTYLVDCTQMGYEGGARHANSRVEITGEFPDGSTQKTFTFPSSVDLKAGYEYKFKTFSTDGIYATEEFTETAPTNYEQINLRKQVYGASLTVNVKDSFDNSKSVWMTLHDKVDNRVRERTIEGSYTFTGLRYDVKYTAKYYDTSTGETYSATTMGNSLGRDGQTITVVIPVKRSLTIVPRLEGKALSKATVKVDNREITSNNGSYVTDLVASKEGTKHTVNLSYKKEGGYEFLGTVFTEYYSPAYSISNDIYVTANSSSEQIMNATWNEPIIGRWTKSDTAISYDVLDEFSGSTETVGNSFDLEWKNPIEENGVTISWEVVEGNSVEIQNTTAARTEIRCVRGGTSKLRLTTSWEGMIKTTDVEIVVNKINPTVSVTAPTNVIYGINEGNFTLNSNVEGIFEVNGKRISVTKDTTKIPFKEIVDGNPTVNSNYSLFWAFAPTELDKYNKVSGTASYVVEARDLNDKETKVSLEENSLVYNGEEQELAVTSVSIDNGVKLNPETDYDIVYENNVNAGDSAIVKIIGKGNYGGTISKTFSIAKAPLSIVNVTAENKTYNGNETVKISGVGLNGIASADSVENVINLKNATAEVSDRYVGSYDHVSMLSEIQLTNANYELKLPANGSQIPLTSPVSITKCPVTVEGVVIDASKVYDGTTSAKISNMGSLTKNFDGEKLSLIPGVANYTDKNVGTEKVVTFTEFELHGGKELIANYELTQPAPQTASITRKPLNLVDGTAAIKDKFYDGTNTASFVDKPTLVADDIVTGDQVVLDYVTQLPQFKSIGSADAENEVEVITNLTITGLDAGNYELQIPEVTAFIKNYAALKGTDYVVNSNDWINGDFTITAAGGCLLSEGSAKDSEWTSTLTVSCNENESDIGTKTFYVKRENGSISKIASENYLMEKVAPTGTVKFRDAESTWSKFVQNITFGLLFKDAQEIIITAADQEGLSGIKKVEWYEYNPVGDKGLSLEELNGISQLSWKNYKEEMKPIVSLKDTKKFVYYVKITDNAGNISYISTDGAVYDATNPTVAGVKDGTTCYASQKVTVTDTNLVSVTLNDVPVVITDRASIELEGNKNATYTIVATDKVGNETIVTVTMKPITALSDQIKKLTEDNVSTSHKSLVKNIQNVITKENIDNATAEEKEELLELSSKCISLLNKIEAIEKAAREKAKREEEARLQAERENAAKEQAAREWAAAQAEKAERERLAALEEAALKASKQEKETEMLTVPVYGEENTVHADIIMKEGTVYIQPLDEKELEHILGENVETGIVEIDLTVLEDEIKEVNLPVETLLSIVEAAEHAHNDTEALAIHLSTGTVLIDDQTMRAVVEAAHGETIHLVLDDDSEHRLNDNQRNAIKDHDVHGHMEAYFVCTQSNRRISNFEGGMATLSKEFHVPEGYQPEGFTVWYVADDGSMEELETWYENGNLVWKVGHFSDFVIIYDEAAVVEAENVESTNAEDVIIEPSMEDVEKTVGFPWWIAAAVIVIVGVAAFVVKNNNKREDEKA